MVSTIDLLEQGLGRTRTFDVISDSTNPDDVFSFLCQDVDATVGSDTLYNSFDVSNRLDGYVQRLEDAVVNKSIAYEGEIERAIGNSVELNILVERSLLEYELKLGSAERTPRRVIGVEELVKGLDGESEITAMALVEHYVELLKLGNITEISSITNSSLNKELIRSNDKMMDELISTLLSIAVEKNIQLPSADIYKMNEIDGRTKWFKECILKVVNTGNMGSLEQSNRSYFDESDASLSQVNYPVNKVNNDDDNNNTNSNTALKDLQFAHAYLTKKYQEDLNQSNQYVNELIRKYQKCEELLKSSNKELEKNTNRLIEAELKNAELQRKLEERTNEVHSLMMSNNLLRVDQLGNNSSALVMSPPTSIESPDNLVLAESPLFSSSASNMPNGDTPSVRILRTEFKKLVEQINSRFEKEIHQLRME